MRWTVAKSAVLVGLTVCAAVAVLFSLTVLAAHGRALAAAETWEQRARGYASSMPRPILAAAVSTETPDVRVSVQPSRSVVAAGDSFTVAVAIEDAPEISGYDFKMDWNPAVFSVTEVAKADFMGAAGGQVQSVDNDLGTLVFGQFFFPPLPEELPSGDGTLAIVTLHATGVGTTTLDLHATRVFTRSGGQIQVSELHVGVAEVVCHGAQILDLRAQSPVLLGETTHFSATVDGSVPITYSWDFGDGSPLLSDLGLDAATHTYAATGTYTAALTVDNVCGVEDSGTVTVTVEEGPCEAVQIQSLSSDAPLTAGVPAHFTATVTGAEPITYNWDFDGDGSPERVGPGLDTVTHTYATAGPYTVTLTVENDCPSQATQSLSVTVEEACHPVVITGLACDTPVTVGELLSITANVTGTHPITYIWDLGDGSAPQVGVGLKTVTHVYTATGTLTATLGVVNPCGSATDSLSFTVEPIRVFLPLVVRPGAES